VAETAPILDIGGLTVAIGQRAVVDGISWQLKPREILAIVGESGCGKSMTALAIARLLPPAARISSGAVMLDGRNLATLSEKKMQKVRGQRISVIFQEPFSSLDPLMTIGDQLVEAIRAHRRVSRPEARRQAVELLALVGIPDRERRMRQYPFEFSGGMCQRAMIAIALACRPDVLLADEPTTALDVTIQAQILDLMRRLREETGTAIVLITHDIGVVAEMAERVLVMYAGVVVEEAPIDDLLTAPLHPYTFLLLRSLPRLSDEPKSVLATISGSVPADGFAGPGCRFSPRCPLADARCRAEEPPLSPKAPGRTAACWHSERVQSLAAGAA
jgi:peptide/nickel transport system ATP-binding protein